MTCDYNHETKRTSSMHLKHREKRKGCFDRFKLLANETSFKHSEEKKRKFPIQRKIDIDTKKHSFKLVLALPRLYFLTVNSLGQDLSQIILVVSI